MNKLSGKYPPIVKWIAVVAIVLLLLPEITRIVLTRIVTAQGVGEAHIDDIDLNVFTGELVVDNLTLLRSGRQVLHVELLAVNIAWLSLFRSEINLESVAVDNASFAVVQHDSGQWQIVVPLPANGSGQEAAQGTALQPVQLPRLAVERMDLTDIMIDIDSRFATAQLVIDDLQLRDLSSWQLTSPSLEISGSWNKAPLQLRINAEPLAVEPDLRAQLRIDRFPLATIAGVTGRSLDGTVDLDLIISGMRTQQGVVESSIDGEVKLNQLGLQYGPLDIHQSALAWQPQVQVSWHDGSLAYRISGDVLSTELSVVENQQNIALLNWQQLSLSSLLFDHNLTGKVDQLSVRALDIINRKSLDSGEKKGSLYNGLLEVASIDLIRGERLTIDRITLSDAQYQIVVQKDGVLQLSALMQSVLSDINRYQQSLAGNVQEVQATPSETSGSIVTTINTFSVEGNSFVALQDLRFPVPVNEQIIIDQLTIEDIDQANKERPTRLTLLSRLGEFSTIKANGEATLFRSKPNVSLSGALQAIALPRISPYSEAYLGYHLTTGQYDHQFNVAVNDNKLSASNQLQLRQLTLSAVNPDAEQPLAKQLDVPLNLALDMLRDSEDNIELDVPINGQLDDPNISVNAIVSDALGKALKNGAASYLKYAIQPYGAVIMAAQFVGDQVSTVTFDPIVYSVGSSDITTEHIAYIGKVSELMRSRPKLTLKLCGFANDNDRQALLQTARQNSALAVPDGVVSADSAIDDQQLLQLAQRRAIQLKRALIDSGIENQRVFVCQPKYQADAIEGVTMAM